MQQLPSPHQAVPLVTVNLDAGYRFSNLSTSFLFPNVESMPIYCQKINPILLPEIIMVL